MCAALLASLVLGGTLYVYPTTLNPGLPIILGGVFAAVLALFRLGKGAASHYHWGMDIGTGLLIWMAFSSQWGLDAYLSQRSLATFVGAVAFLWAVQCGTRNSRDWRLSAHTFVMLCSLVSLAAWPKGITVAIKTGHIPALTGTFNNPDTFSILPLFALMLAPGLLERATYKVGGLVCLQIGILFVTLVATGCRASLLGLGVGLIAFGGTLFYNRSNTHFKHLKILLAVPIALALLVLPLSNFGVSVFDKYSKTLSTESIAREETRIEVASYGWKAAIQHPLTGAGPGCFGLAFQTVRPPGHDRLYVNIAHNDPVEVAVELGLPGFLLWTALTIACLQKPFKLLQNGRRPVAAASMMSAVLAITIYSFFNFVISERPALWAEFWIFGLALSFPSSRLTYREKTAVRYLFSLCLLALSFWSVQFGYRSVQADSLFLQSQNFARELQVERAIQSLESAIEFQPQRANLRLEFVKLEKSWSAFYPAYESQDRRLKALEAAEEASPANLGVLLAISEFYVETGDLTRAASYLDRALQLTPHRPSLRERRAALAIRQGDLETAISQLILESPNKKRNEQLATLLVALELEAAGRSQPILEASRKSETTERLNEILELAVNNCAANQHWKAGLNLAVQAAKMSPDDLCLQLRQANLLGKVENTRAEWELLDKTIVETKPSSDTCYGTLLERWYLLSLEQGQRDKALDRLKDDLEEDGRIVSVRILLSQALLEDGKTDKAIALLREGLDKNSRSLPLLKELAFQYEKIGHRDLAINYYREASEVDPKNQSLKAKLRELRKASR